MLTPLSSPLSSCLPSRLSDRLRTHSLCSGRNLVSLVDFDREFHLLRRLALLDLFSLEDRRALALGRRLQVPDAQRVIITRGVKPAAIRARGQGGDHVRMSVQAKLRRREGPAHFFRDVEDQDLAELVARGETTRCRR